MEAQKYYPVNDEGRIKPSLFLCIPEFFFTVLYSFLSTSILMRIRKVSSLIITTMKTDRTGTVENRERGGGRERKRERAVFRILHVGNGE